ncbi:Methyltransferase domain-containing protein [Halogranum amylolyticum]|uniref:Methyltransferase domain-containing protein n=1 Tax=Halogranum amylolyticum TaxID=660520 RepID=A0A1H8TC39_9EURY|nr:N-6 DNA methylase [Halogranum amylolyticum]SEO88660.1 Methyltransferase domain-containing protein [Halogranum amylolyticum]
MDGRDARRPLQRVLAPEGSVQRAYRAAAGTLLVDGDDRLREALATWSGFVRRHHGPAFAEASPEEDGPDDGDVDTGYGDVGVDLPDVGDDTSATARRVFVDTLAYDFVLTRLRRSFEDAFAVTFSESDPTATADLFLVSLDSVHARVADKLDSSTVVDAGFAALDADDFRRADPTVLGDGYERAVSHSVRLALGQYYTPLGVASLALPEEVADAESTVLDPGCGGGAFLVAAVEAKRRALDCSPATAVDRITDSVFGIDLDPVAVRCARLAYALALAPILADLDATDPDDAPRELRLPVAFGDALALTDDVPRLDGELFAPRVDVLVGNPPWLTWDRLAPAVKERWRDGYVSELDLLPARGPDSLLGYANDDLSVPFAWVCLDRYLRRGGRAGLVLKRDQLTGSAGRLFRRLRVGDRRLRLDAVEDLAGLSPFGTEVGADAAVYRFTADVATSSASVDVADSTDVVDTASRFPVPMRRWRRREGVAPAFDSLDAMAASLSTTETALCPVDSADSAGSWVREDAERRAVGECAHEIRHGVKDDAKAVFGLDRPQLSELEPDHVYPYLKSRHIVSYGLFGYDLQLVPMRRASEDNEASLAATAPRTYAYLRAHRERLVERSSTWFDRGPFYTLFGLGPYTWADYKVVWCRLGFEPQFAVVSTVDDSDLGERPVVPGDHCLFLPTDDADEAHLLCALLNSAPYQRCLRDVAGGGKAALSKSVVSRLSLPAYHGTDRQRRLARLSRRAHGVVADHTGVPKREYDPTEIPALAAVQTTIDRLAERLLVDGENENS